MGPVLGPMGATAGRAEEILQKDPSDIIKHFGPANKELRAAIQSAPSDYLPVVETPDSSYTKLKTFAQSATNKVITHYLNAYAKALTKHVKDTSQWPPLVPGRTWPVPPLCCLGWS